MGNVVLALDTIVNASFFFVGKWTPALKRNQSRDLLRLVISKLYGASKGEMFRSRIRCSQESLGADLGLSREWVCKLLARLQDARWIEYRAPRLPDGRYEVGFFRPGRTLKRLLCVLLGTRNRKKAQPPTAPVQHSRVNESSQSSPFIKKQKEKTLLFLQELRKALAKGDTHALLTPERWRR
jgi:hypothetical protein